MVKFLAVLDQVGINPCVTVPDRVSRHFGKRGYVPVVAHFETGSVRSTLVPIGGGVHRLYVNGQMLKCTSSRVGQSVSIGLEADTKERMPNMPEGIAKALKGSAVAMKRWQNLTPSKQKEVLRYVSGIVAEAIRDRNIGRLLKILESESGTGVLCGIQIKSRTRSVGPNQPLEPMARSVTPRAGARVAPARAMAHH